MENPSDIEFWEFDIVSDNDQNHVECQLIGNFETTFCF